MTFIPFLQTTGTAASASTTGSLLMTVLPFALIIVIFYFFLIRPQNKKQKETEKMLNALKKGDKVITAGGIHGVVSSVKEKTIVLKVDDNTKIEFNRSAITSVKTDESAAEPKEDKKTKKTNASEKEETVEEKAKKTTETSEAEENK